MAKKMIRVLLFTYGEVVDNPLYHEGSDQPETVMREGLARLGEVVDITRPYDLARGEELGAFFTDAERKKVEAGTYKGPDAPTVAQAVLASAQAEIQPIEVEPPPEIADMSSEQVAEVIKSGNGGKGLNVDETINLADENDVDSINKVLDAESLASKNEPRVGVTKGLEARLAKASQNTPENDAEEEEEENE